MVTPLYGTTYQIGNTLGITTLQSIGYPSSPTPTGPIVTPEVVPTVTGIDPNEVARATYGKTIPIFTGGKARFGGRIVWGPKFRTVSSVQVFDVIVSLAFSAKPTGSRAIYQIAMDSKLAWSSVDGYLLAPGQWTYRFYQGTSTQLPDAMVTADQGTGKASAYRPQILVALEGVPMTSFGNTFPWIAALIGDTTDGADPDDGINLGESFERLAYSPFVGMTDDDMESVNISDIAQAVIHAENVSYIDELKRYQTIYRSWDIIQADKLRLRDRGDNATPDITLDRSRLISGNGAGPFTITIQDEKSIPRERSLTYIDPDQDYIFNTMRAQRPREPFPLTSSIGRDDTQLSIALDSATALSQITFVKFFEEIARERVQLKAHPYAYSVEPGDLMSLPTDFGNFLFKVDETLHGQNYTVDIVGSALYRCGISIIPGEGDDEGEVLEWTTVFSAVMNAFSTAWNGFNLRAYFAAVGLSDVTGTHVRLTLESGSSDCVIGAMTLGHRSSGDNYDIDGTPTPVTVGGLTSFTIPTAGTLVTDAIPFSFDGSKDFVVAAYFNGGSGHDAVRANASTANTNTHAKAGSNETATGNVTGYSTSGGVRMINKIEVRVAS